jgi:hypothetical protein
MSRIVRCIAKDLAGSGRDAVDVVHQNLLGGTEKSHRNVDQESVCPDLGSKTRWEFMFDDCANRRGSHLAEPQVATETREALCSFQAQKLLL